jgi:hypothetical protein
MNALRTITRGSPLRPSAALSGLALIGLVLVLGFPAAALAASAPTVFTTAAYSTSTTTATIEGAVNPAGQSTTYAVNWDLASSNWCLHGTGSAANTTTGIDLGVSDTDFHTVSVGLTGLTAGTGYCAQLTATNGTGTGTGDQFTWIGGAPGADTNEVDSTGATTATVLGDVNPAAQSTTYHVDYDTQDSTFCGGHTATALTSTSAQSLGFTDSTFHDVSVNLTALSGGVAYCAEIVAVDASGTTDALQVSWTQGLPIVNALSITSTGATTATLGGNVDPVGQSTTYAAEYGLASSNWCQGTNSTGMLTTSPQPLGFTDNNVHNVTVAITGLTVGTDYCAELVATNPSGAVESFQVQQWTQGLPFATTSSVTSTDGTHATVAGQVNPSGQSDTTYFVKYDTQASTFCGGGSATPPTSTTPVSLSFSDSTFHDVTVNLTGLTAGTSYCAQLIATNGGGEADGDQIPWTQGIPTVSTFDAFSTGADTATVEGAVNPSGQSTQYQVQYATAASTWCTSSGATGSPSTTSLVALGGSIDSTPHDVSVNLTGLSTGTLYCGRVIATNGTGEGDGEQVTWTQGTPTANTFAAFSTSATAVTITGHVNPAGQTTQYQVAYDDASSTWCTSSGASGVPTNTSDSADLGFTDNAFHDVSVDLTGLTEGNSYCAALTATNPGGSTTGFQVSWTQGTPSADTFDANTIGTSAVTLDGHINAAGAATTYRVQYDVVGSDWCSSIGNSGSPAHTSPAVSLGFTDGAFHDVSVELTELTPNTSYCGELIATNADGTGFTPAGASTTWTQPAGTPQHTLTVSRAGNGSGTVSSSPAGISCGSTCSAQIDEGTQVTLTATPAAGSRFAGWSGGGCSGTGQCVVTMSGPVPVTATFATTQSLTVSKSGAGSGTVASSPAGISCGSTCSMPFDTGTQVTLSATPAAGSTFAGWSGGGCSGTGDCVVTLSSDTAVTATFNLSPHMLTVTRTGSGSGTVSSSPAGINCGVTCAHAYDVGTQVTLTATPDSGSTFAGWSGGGCSGTGQCVVTLNADTTVTATFTPVAVEACVVPKLVGKTLSAAKTALKKAHCAVGKVTKVKSSKKNKNHVVSQSPKPGTHLKKDAKVALKVGK